MGDNRIKILIDFNTKILSTETYNTL